MKRQSNEFFSYVFYLDFVSLSNRKLGSTEEQVKKVELLFNMITKSKFFKKSGDKPILSHTGDGVAICFRKNIRLPLELAIDIHKKINQYNKTKTRNEKIKVRIGINSGLIFKAKGVDNRSNYWGPGIINAQRIMSFGDSNHILLDSTTAYQLTTVSNRFQKAIKDLGIIKIKHGEKIHFYSAYDQNFGNKNKPKALVGEPSPELIEKTGKLILEELKKHELNPKNLIKLLRQKQISQLKISIIPKKRVKTSIKRKLRKKKNGAHKNE